MHHQDQCLFVFMKVQVTSFSDHQQFYCLSCYRSFWLVKSYLDTMKLDCCKVYTCPCMEKVLIDQYCTIVFSLSSYPLCHWLYLHLVYGLLIYCCLIYQAYTISGKVYHYSTHHNVSSFWSNWVLSAIKLLNEAFPFPVIFDPGSYFHYILYSPSQLKDNS